MSTPRPATTQPDATQPAAPASAAPASTGPESTGPESTAPEPAASESDAPEPAAHESAAHESAAPAPIPASVPAHPVTTTSRLTLRRFGTPFAVAATLALLFLWLSTLTLDSIEQRTLNAAYLLDRTREHLVLTVVSSALVALLAIPAGIAAYRVRSKAVRAFVIGLGNIGQATPAVGVVILLAIVWQTGFYTALISLVAYCFLPVLRNTLTGLEQVDHATREAARGMGMTPRQVLWRIELPLASPVILAGLRTALVFSVGVATIATFINAGGLGDMIVNGLKLQRYPVIVVGAVLVASIAVLIDWAAGLVEDLVRPRGL